MGWICDECGALCTGDMCTHCGRARPPQSPVGPGQGSYLSLIGFRSAGRGFGISAGPVLAVVAVIAFFLNRVIFVIADVALLVAYAPTLILSGRLLMARWRRR